MTTCCGCKVPVKDTKPVWRDGRVINLCLLCVHKTKPIVKARLSAMSHLEAWKKTQVVVPVAKPKTLEEMTKEELEEEIARLSA